MLINQQPTEPILPDGNLLEVHSTWYSIQGEGPLVGTPAVFIRLAGCVLKCPGCDTDYTSNRDRTTACDVSKTAEMLMGHALGYRKRTRAINALAVITGGEPLRQPIGSLITQLRIRGFAVQIETNGTLYRDELPWGFFTVVCSPKASIHPKLMSRIDALKYVVQFGHVSSTDGLPTHTLGGENLVGRPSADFHGEIFVQPMDEGDERRNRRNLQTAIVVCMRFGYRLGIQTHKIVGLP